MEDPADSEVGLAIAIVARRVSGNDVSNRCR
jgi:hypothetical protein